MVAAPLYPRAFSPSQYWRAPPPPRCLKFFHRGCAQRQRGTCWSQPPCLSSDSGKGRLVAPVASIGNAGCSASASLSSSPAASIQVNQANRGYRSWKSILAYLTGLWSQITVRHVLSGKIQRIRNTLDKLSENQKTFNLESTLGIWTPSTTALAPRNDPKWPQSVGLDGQAAKNLLQLLKGKDDVQKMLISVLGRVGPGSTLW
ncbi:unnamed protein product [Urochloa humidicola]